MSWTDDRVEKLKTLWAEGHSASQIAKQLGGVTRNAVIGKVHRLGLSGRATPSRPVKRPPRLARPKPVQARKSAGSLTQTSEAESKSTYVEQLPSISLEPAVLENGKTANVLSIRDNMCKWPIGDPADKNFAFCGRACVDGGPYCAEHAKIAFQPNKKKERKANADYDYVRKIAG